ncbi:hypothetical protein [Mycobacterium vicinigordonae]|uniref:Uncharacterized protein n=1 Tax=Mycobacterium vicinigordonae TaxID=1719132 RepID=A0A7D6E4Q3_9MYCO|nr:hypothetical protein [Mycobacterium vicinigordonae]QLL09106.1 hypothetical protein H0P51_09595 [Mycobacterium vicinigordonae]
MYRAALVAGEVAAAQVTGPVLADGQDDWEGLGARVWTRNMNLGGGVVGLAALAGTANSVRRPSTPTKRWHQMEVDANGQAQTNRQCRGGVRERPIPAVIVSGSFLAERGVLPSPDDAAATNCAPQ